MCLIKGTQGRGHREPSPVCKQSPVCKGDRLVVLGDDASNGLALLKEDGFLKLAEEIKKY